jgi:enterochelin esterase-like enzyme
VRVIVASGPRPSSEPADRPPGWLTGPASPGRTAAFSLPAPALGGPIAVRTWSPGDAADDEPLPLLVANDGPDYEAQARLTRYLAAGVTSRRLPRLRAALLAPGFPDQHLQRDQWYSANPGYARALALTVMPALTGRLAVTARTGMGASLGALAMLHTHCRYPDAFDALFLQSGSFFCPRFDSQEREFRYYRRIVRFVAGVHRDPEGRLPARRIPVVLTCGEREENVRNNRLMAGTLRARGYPASLHEVPGLHNFTAWRDALDPYLTRLLRQMCS